jgi:hypothetical protein
VTTIDRQTASRWVGDAGSTPATGVRRFLAEEGLLVASCAVFVALWSLRATALVRADSWLTLLAGREIVRHGLPSHDTLAVMSHGRPWVDQQWLGQLAYYGLAAAGGMKLAVLATIVLLATSIAIAIAFARRRGASAMRILPFVVLPAGFFTSFVRTQVFSQLLFVCLLALLASESRRRSRRVFLAFPLLVLWANLHGAVVVGAALVTLLGASELRRAGRLARAVTLVVGPWLCLFATPYGLSVAGYYRDTLTNPLFRSALTEWQPPTLLSPIGLPAFVLAGTVVAVLAARARLLTPFERAALVFTSLGALMAVRSITWLAYAALMLLPRVLDEWWPSRRPGASARRIATWLAAAAAAFAVLAFAAAAAAPRSHVTRLWPAAGVDAVSAILRDDPHARVLASYEYGDWLLYTSPTVRGRIAFDGRWEILPRARMKELLDYLYQSGARWERPAAGYRVLVLNPTTEGDLIRTYESRPGTRVLFRNSELVILDRGTQSSR